MFHFFIILMYPLMVGSLATIIQNLPWMSPTPVIIPPEFTYSFPYNSYPARGENSKNGDPGSSNFSIRSLTGNFPALDNFSNTLGLFFVVT